jgi:hypothetical protein
MITIQAETAMLEFKRVRVMTVRGTVDLTCYIVEDVTHITEVGSPGFA